MRIRLFGKALGVILFLFIFIFYCRAWPYGFGVAGNNVTITSGSKTVHPSVDVNGNVVSVDNLPVAGEGGQPSVLNLSLTLVNDGVDLGNYTVDLGLALKDLDSSRRLVAVLPGIKVEVSSGNTVSVIIPENATLYVEGETANGTIVRTSFENKKQDGPVTASGGTLNFNAWNLKTKIENRFQGSSESDLANITKQGRYQYQIFVQSSVPVGYVNSDNSVTPFPSYEIASCGSGKKKFEDWINDPSDYNPLNHYLTGKIYELKGVFSVGKPLAGATFDSTLGVQLVDAGACPSPGPPPSPPPTEEEKPSPAAEDIENAVNEALETGNVETLKETFEQVDDKVDEILRKGKIEEEDKKVLSDIADAAGEAVDRLGDVLDKVEDIDQAFDVLEGVDDLVAGGLKAALTIGDEEKAVKVVEKVGEVVSKVLDKAAEVLGADVVRAASEALDKLSKIVSSVTDVITPAVEEKPEVVIGVVDQIQDEVAAVIEDLRQALEGAMGVFAGGYFAQVSEEGRFSLEEISGVVGKIRDTIIPVARAATEVETGLKENVVEAAGKTLSILARSAMDELAKEKNFDASSVDVNSAFVFDDLMDITGVDLTEAFKTGSPLGMEVVDPAKKVVKMEEGTYSSKDILESAISGVVEGASVRTENGEIFVELGGFKYPVYISRVMISPEDISQGFHATTDGTIWVVKGDVAIEMTPAPYDPESIREALSPETIGVEEVNFYKGVFEVKSSDAFYEAAFGYGVQGTGVALPEISFTLVGNDPSSKGYMVEIRYADGSVQHLAPFVGALKALTSELDKYLHDNYRINRETGTLDVYYGGEWLEFKFDYVIQPLSLGDLLFFEANKDENGIYWEVDDFNGDGLLDARMWTRKGKQIIWSASK